MIASLDPSPIPAYAVTCWCDERYVYVALPMTAGGVPYIQKHALSEGGLSRALEMLRAHRREAILPTAPINYTSGPDQPMIKRDNSPARKRLLEETTEAQRESARQVLAKLGIK